MWWLDLLTRWDLIQRDLAVLYHLDVTDPAVLTRPWPAVRTYILGLLAEPTSRLVADLRR